MTRRAEPVTGQCDPTPLQVRYFKAFAPTRYWHGSCFALCGMTTRCVLVVDDDRLTRESLGEAIRSFGCGADLADCGTVALGILSGHPHDLIISDVDMPDISGFELLERLHQRSITTPCVLMSARADRRLDVAASQAGAVTLLPKPVQLGPFTQLMNRLLDLN